MAYDRCNRQPLIEGMTEMPAQAPATAQPDSASAEPTAVAPPPKALYEVGEIPPLGHVPENMYAWTIRQERHGPPDEAMKVEVVPTWAIGEEECLVFVMAAGVNYNGVWASLGKPVSPFDG
ncbi:MAG TPA: hypothetical protein VMO81_13350, partial [Aestuariivirgaceae bacterium]|nr:hypothetical protein [Aestuariivirgaceae bacterium]